ncbi:MAG: type B DNA-directed DNA polymerase [Thermoplasmata archaeon]
MLVEIDVWNNAYLWYRENGKVIMRKYDFLPELLISGNENILEELESLDMEGVVRIERKKFRDIENEYYGISIKARSSNFFNVVNTIDRYYNYHRAKLFNVDIRFSVRFLADMGIFPFYDGRERFSIMNTDGIVLMEIKKIGENLKINEKTIYSLDYKNLEKIVESEDPDIIIFPGGDSIIKKMIEIARKNNDEFCLGRRRGWRTLGEKEYFSYGREYYKTGALIPIGRSIVDPETSFIYSEGGIRGLLTVSRISSLPVSYASRSTPGTLVSTMEVYEALKKGIAVPFHKFKAEKEKTLETLINADRGGIVYQPQPGLYFDVVELDFTSMYPSIIVRKNLSQETVNAECSEYDTVPEIGYNVCKKRGFLSEVLSPLLELRIKTKSMKKNDTGIKGIDTSLKWMLVTSFGYTGYRNAKFGSIEVHEAINAYAREYFLRAKEIIESKGCKLIHGIVDSIMVQGKVTKEVLEEIEKDTSLPIEISDEYFWVKILPEKGIPSVGAPGRYLGLKKSFEFKVRGLMMRRQDVPQFIKNFQEESLEILKNLFSRSDIEIIKKRINEKFMEYKKRIERRDVDKNLLLIQRRVSRYPFQYISRTASAILLDELYERGEMKRPGEYIRYLVHSTNPLRVVDESRIENVDYSIKYYVSLLREAYMELLP